MATDVIKVRINPDNRQVDIRDPNYISQWVAQLEELRAGHEADIRQAVEAGEFELPVDETNPLVATPEKTLRFMAHAQAEKDMQHWAVMGGIGLHGITAGEDHGRAIEYVDDPSVPLFGHEVIER